MQLTMQMGHSKCLLVTEICLRCSHFCGHHLSYRLCLCAIPSLSSPPLASIPLSRLMVIVASDVSECWVNPCVELLSHCSYLCSVLPLRPFSPLYLSLQAHDGGIYCMSLMRVLGASPQLVTCGADKSVAFWDTFAFRVTMTCMQNQICFSCVCIVFACDEQLTFT